MLQGCLINILYDLGPGWDMGGAAFLREAQRAGLSVYSARGLAALEDAEGRPRRRLCLLLYRQELLGKALDGVAEQPRLGDGSIEKARLVDIFHLCQIEPEMALLDHHGGQRLPERLREDWLSLYREQHTSYPLGSEAKI